MSVVSDPDEGTKQPSAVVGRAAERAAIDGLVAGARRAESGVLVLAGPPGIGTSTLVGYAIDAATEFNVLSVAGAASEQALAYAGVHQVVLPILDGLQGLPAPQRAARAASVQGEFWAFHDRLFADQPQPNSGRLTPAFLEGIAAELGLDADQFRSDMDSTETTSAIDADFDEALSVGVNGTPAFMINGEPVFGAQPTSVFVDAIERAAAAVPDR